MSQIRALLAKVFIVLSLSFGQLPRALALLDRFQPPSVVRVIRTRRRRLAYTDFFTWRDSEGRGAAPIVRSYAYANWTERDREKAAQATPDDRYIPVRTA